MKIFHQIGKILEGMIISYILALSTLVVSSIAIVFAFLVNTIVLTMFVIASPFVGMYLAYEYSKDENSDPRFFIVYLMAA